MKLNFKLFVLLFMAMTMFNCETDDSGDYGSSQGINQEFEFGAIIQKDFIGTVVDESNIAISNATVIIGAKTAQTDSNGVFIIEDADVQEKFAYIQVTKTGYLNGMKSVVPTEGGNSVAIMLLTETVQALTASNEILMPNGTKVTFNGGFEDAAGNLYSGSVHYSINHVDPSSPTIAKEMPGMLLGKTTSDEFEVLETYGMLHVSLTDASGNALQLATGSTAEIRMPIPTELTGAPDTIPLWSFDEGAGYWVEEGFATKTGSEYVGMVSHFSWWNCDASFPTTEFCLNVEDDNGNPLANVQVDLSFGINPFPVVGVSSSEGQICGLIPVGETITLVAYDYCGNEIYTNYISSSFTGSSQTIVISAGSAQPTVITGNFLDCDYNPITEGYVQLNYGALTSYTVIENGTFEISTLICNSDTSISIEGIDYLTTQSTGEIPFTLLQPITDLGTVISCNAVDEFFTYQLDDETPITSINVAGYSDPSGGFNINAVSGIGELHFSIDTTVLGTYTLADFDAFLYIADINLDTGENTTSNFQFVITGYDPIGGYISVTFSGDYVDAAGVTHSISGTIHSRRDS
ncbi:carboxypeptidase-like regulatory domain-containing protein [Winogradskyella undariae]|uniref:carboxypeptidase-like regulatory domain-containing protein n=1 Tax=Winogradskyella undariae TaxID=1285465 RepID=UPI0015CC540D|nr:carboxypeptidase-like regulatory domain-containing protein [Winogradskyella undariae]